jgi:metal-responsive CopG/Arc/MetJ family transcriptional regulator
MTNKKRKPKPSKTNPEPPPRDAYLPQVGVRLPYDVIKELDEFVAESGGRLNRSDLIRRGMDIFLPILREERKKREKEKE